MPSENTLLRLCIFGGVLALVFLWERVSPCRSYSASMAQRWFSNLGISLINRLLLSALPLGLLAHWAAAPEQSMGLFNIVNAPGWVVLVGSVLLLDLVIYAQHRLFHRVPLLWRMHRMHHADVDFDVSTGVRFHPLEAMLSLLVKGAAVLLLGAPVFAVLVFEIVLSSTSLFNHANASLPRSLDKVVRWLLVTPDMHRVHHSIRDEEMHSNFGFNLTWWDHLFRSYRARSIDEPQDMQIGLAEFREPDELQLRRMLLQPFR